MNKHEKLKELQALVNVRLLDMAYHDPSVKVCQGTRLYIEKRRKELKKYRRELTILCDRHFTWYDDKNGPPCPICDFSKFGTIRD